ncbi:hypothetical protein [Cellulomonas composti]|uniref:Uncharacterized protein n=1 Tax=Cellulomonas composti TaxID=266130 RepID=A0A511JD08_9CELL|nr:hypothetical protein [Cellulomonas composti]GEL95865.1 hypothetical protein CCO02nite_25230 [Cellulomonas composti]
MEAVEGVEGAEAGAGDAAGGVNREAGGEYAVLPEPVRLADTTVGVETRLVPDPDEVHDPGPDIVIRGY